MRVATVSYLGMWNKVSALLFLCVLLKRNRKKHVSQHCLHHVNEERMTITVYSTRNTVEPPNKTVIANNKIINSDVLSFVYRGCPLFEGSESIRTIGKLIFGTWTCALCREVYYTVSLSRRVHCRRFHCMHVARNLN